MRKIKNIKELSIKAFDIRRDALDIIMAGGGGHIGGDMSEPEILLTLYERMNVTPETQDSPDRDRFVLSKGHCVETLYAVLSYEGFMNLDEVKAKFSKFGSEYIGHPHNTLPGIEMNSGSLGHGLSVSVGMALAGKMDKKSYRVYTLMGDG
ncbi:MAG: transketolase, partial [Synergistaceae bacterium]|nr:transketolase [Synergistaceae bacterium]